MTDWTKEDTEALGELVAPDFDCFACGEERQYGSTGAAHDGFCALPFRAAEHIEALEARIATLEAANHELRVLYEDGKLHADEMVDLLQDRIATLEAEREEVARELRALGKKIRDAYTHADDLAPGEAHDALAPIHGLALRVSAVAARLERKGA